MGELVSDLSHSIVADAVVAKAVNPVEEPCGCGDSVEFLPPDIAQRDVTRWNGIEADTVEIVRREPYEYRSHGSSCHMLIMSERGARDDGETIVEGLPTSTLRDFSGKLSFVP